MRSGTEVCAEVCKSWRISVNLVDLVESVQTSTSIYYLVFTIYHLLDFSIILLANFGVDTAENGPLKVCQHLAKTSKS